MVIRPGEFHAAALLHGGVVDGGPEDNPRRAAAVTAATAAGRKVHRGDLRPGLVRQRQTNARLVVRELRARAEHRVGVEFLQLRSHRPVLHRVRAAGVQALVHFHPVDGQAHVALAVGDLFLTVHRQALYRSGTAEVLPGARALPGRKARAAELLRLPLTLAHLVGDAAPLVTVFLIHRRDGRRQRVVAAFQRCLLRHVVRVAPAARTTGDVHRGDLRAGLSKKGEFYRVILLVDFRLHASRKAAFHGGSSGSGVFSGRVGRFGG